MKETYNATAFALSATAQSDGVRVVLTGEGADELFAGYTSYRFDAFRRQQGNAPTATSGEMVLREKLWGDPAFLTMPAGARLCERFSEKPAPAETFRSRTGSSR